MKTAIDEHGNVVSAAPGAPQSATCPECGELVNLYVAPHCVYYRHNKRNGECPLQDVGDLKTRPYGTYALSLAFIRDVIKDAMNGAGIDELTYLFSPLGQWGIARLFDTEDPYTTTQEICRRLVALDEQGRNKVHHAITWSSHRQMAKIFDKRY
jgi:hypothetical protein